MDEGVIGRMKMLRNTLFILVAVFGLSLAVSAQKQDDKKVPPKERPPVINPGDKSRPRENPPGNPPRDTGRDKPKKPQG